MEVLGLDFRYDNGYKVFNNINIKGNFGSFEITAFGSDKTPESTKVERGKFAAIVGPSGGTR